MITLLCNISDNKFRITQKCNDIIWRYKFINKKLWVSNKRLNFAKISESENKDCWIMKPELNASITF